MLYVHPLQDFNISVCAQQFIMYVRRTAVITGLSFGKKVYLECILSVRCFHLSWWIIAEWWWYFLRDYAGNKFTEYHLVFTWVTIFNLSVKYTHVTGQSHGLLVCVLQGKLMVQWVTARCIWHTNNILSTSWDDQTITWIWQRKRSPGGP